MSNSFSSRPNSGLIDAAHTIVTGTGEKPGDFGLSAAEISSLTSASAALGAAVLAQSEARALLDQAISAKDQARAAILTSLSQAAASVYSDAALSDVQIRSLGLAPRRSGGVRPQALFAPTDLVAKGFSDSTLRLSWTRGTSNIPGTTFQVEYSADGSGFEIVDTTTRATILLSGYAPGVAAWFRVVAKRSGLASPPSSVATAYAPGLPARVQLKVA